MKCNNCGKEMDNDDFCDECGIKRVDDKFSPNILLGKDGIYRWTYEMNMWKNPTIIITLGKIFFLCSMFPVLLVTVLELFEQGLKEALVAFGEVFFVVMGIMTVLLLLAYIVVAIINGGSYQVVFELSEEGVNHIQVEKQFKKNQVMAWITIMAGAAAGNPQVAGAGLLAASKSNSYCTFKDVKKIIAKPRRHVIYVNEVLEHNQVYVAEADYDHVLAYMVSRCEKAIVM